MAAPCAGQHPCAPELVGIHLQVVECTFLVGRHKARPLQWMRGAVRLGRVRLLCASKMLVNLYKDKGGMYKIWVIYGLDEGDMFFDTLVLLNFYVSVSYLLGGMGGIAFSVKLL